eukprot:SAG31_NODE_37883_length_300_cov_1.268657_2_plen_41_part_01
MMCSENKARTRQHAAWVLQPRGIWDEGSAPKFIKVHCCGMF